MFKEEVRLDLAVEQGIITREQAAAIRALDTSRPEGEAPRGLNAAMIAYALGAITVVVAMGWFLSERWRSLGPVGVIAVCGLYAAVFLVTARRLRTEGFPVASGFAVVLAVAVVPAATAALLELTEWFEQYPGYSCYGADFDLWACRGEEIVIELATAAASLIALRRVRFSLLALPLAWLTLRFVFHAADMFGGAGSGRATDGWVWMVGASLLAAVAYELDRRQRADEDFALWLHFTAAVAALVASVALLGPDYRYFHHFLVPSALVAFAASLLLRRVAWLALGMAWFVWYLGWLAKEVFHDSPAFPIVLAALGIGVIILTVWVQRNAAVLVARFGTVTADGRPRFPGGSALLLAPALVGLLMFSDGRSRDLEREAESRWQSRRYQLRRAREEQVRREREAQEAQRPNSAAGGRRGETPPSRTP